MSDVTATGTGAEHRHEPLYLPDGDIVLSAPIDEQTTWLFRVDRIFLSRQSGVFRDMLSLPAVSDANERYDGVPRVRLADHALHLSQLLAAIYDPASIPLKKQATNVPDLYNIMKLAAKYEVTTVELVIKRHVQSAWSFTLPEWELREFNKDDVYLYMKREDYPDSLYLADTVPEPASAIRFGVDFGCHEMLPRAFLDLSLIPLRNVWERRQGASGPFRTSHMISGLIYSRYARWDLLRAPELLALLRGKELLTERWRLLVADLHESLPLHAEGSDPKTQCGKIFYDRMQEFSREALDRAQGPDGAGRLDSTLLNIRRLLNVAPEWSLCFECRGICVRAVRRWAEGIWGDLPKIFAIDTIT